VRGGYGTVTFRGSDGKVVEAQWGYARLLGS